ncbi:MAG: hypothetical protein ACRD1K_18725, partial [Acidimicrobiales bacterium]
VVARSQPMARRAPSRWRCTYNPIDLAPDVAVYEEDGTPIIVDGTGRWLAKECVDGDARTGKMVYVKPRDPVEVRQEAFEHLELPTPQINMNPQPDADQVVTIRTFLWTDKDLWQPQESTVSVPGVSVTVRAVPDRLEWDMGTGATERVVCWGPGSPWNPAAPEGDQDTSCSFVYRRSSAAQPGQRYPVTATLFWRVSWAVAGAAGGGSLGVVPRSTSTSVRVVEVQTVNF